MAGPKKTPNASAQNPPPPVSKPPARKRVPTVKAKAQQTKNKKGEDDSSDDSAVVEEDPNSSKESKTVDWEGDPDLSVRLIAHITEDKTIKQSLYPPCGPNASTKKGGGKPKADAQWKLAVLLLGEMPEFKDDIEACKTAKQKSVYVNKIKNRLTVMAKTTRDYNKEMGETGAGIQKAAEIDMNVKNVFTTKWAEISGKCPWYFEMRNLIAQRPNLVPTGLGNSNTHIIEGVIMPETTTVSDNEDDDGTSSIRSVPIDGWDPTPEHTPEPKVHKRSFDESFDDDGAAAGSGDDYEPTSPAASESAHPVVVSDDDDEATEPEVKRLKPKGKGKTGRTHPKNPAKPSTSKPAAPMPAIAPAPKPSKKTKIAEFSEIAKDEERTRQKEIELAALRTRQQIKATEVKGRLLEKREDRRRLEKQGRREERMQKLRLKELRLRHAHELQMAATRTGSTSATSHAATFLDSHSHSSASGSHYASSEPTDYRDFDGFSGNAVAGPSTSGYDMEYSLHDFANSSNNLFPGSS
ncbi:hypothetical protein B0H13DRAFT_2665471 [Mycena leptocephala]|nr:hypothetical protein B0H13DRAFT_2665471 [Mycena leptocephala]